MAMTKTQMDAEAAEYSAAHKELDAQDAGGDQVASLGDIVKKGAAALGKAILGDRTPNDATAEGRAYKLHLMESEGSGTKPMSRDEFEKSRTTQKA